VVQEHPHVFIVRIAVEVIYSASVDERGAPLYSVHDVALAEQELSKIRAVLARDARNQGYWLVLHRERLRRTAIAARLVEALRFSG
jgi:hypothetical protein